MQIRNEDVGAAHQIERDVVPFPAANVERDRLLAARRENPAVVVGALRQRSQLRQMTIRIADLRMFDVHDVRAEVAEDGAGSRPENERREFDDANAVEQIRVGHAVSPLFA